MALGKWIGGFLGFMSGGPLAAFAGYFIGMLFDHLLDSVNQADSYNGPQGQHPHNEAFGSSDYRQAHYYEGQRNSFLFSMMVLAAYVIKADGRVMHSEMEFVRRFLRQNFGSEAEKEGNDVLLRLFEEQKIMEAQHPGSFRKQIIACCQQIGQNLDRSACLQLLNFLVLIAQADGHVSQKEVDCLHEIALHMGLSQQEADSMLNLHGNSLEDAYKVLEVSPEATDDELKKAFRRLALKHHPDRVASLGDDVRRAAEQKFKEINEAKERIWKARGL